jgi:glycosyltransferase involved in cell wall biosynthesis
MTAEDIGVPTVSVGIPVYNGEDFVGQAIESLLNQTFTDFELLIQDNASTDATADICRSFADRDRRIRYVRNSANVGAINNFNLVFERARGRYFKWAAHDDLCAASFLERCVAILDQQPDVVLASGQTQLINDDGSPVAFDDERQCYVTRHGAPVGVLDPAHRAERGAPASRFWDVLVRTNRTFEIFGLIRTEALRKTVLQENYYGSDKVLLAQLSLLGPFHLDDEILLLRRCHPKQSSVLSTSEKGSWIQRPTRDDWLTHRIRHVIPGYFRVVNKSPVSSAHKLLCYGAILYRLVAPQTWVKQFMPGRLTES